MRTVLLLTAAIVLAGCDRSPKTWEAEAFRQERLEAHAQSWHLPDGPPDGPLNTANQIDCAIRKSAAFDFERRPHKLVVVWASENENCSGLTAVSLTLWDLSQNAAGPVVELIGPASLFGLRPTARCIADCGPSGGPGPQPDNTLETSEFLRQLSSLRPIGAASLPAWPIDQLQPLLPPGFTVTPTTDRNTYEAARALNSTTLCWKTEESEMRCVASAPRRRPSQIDLFTARSSDDFTMFGIDDALNRPNRSRPDGKVSSGEPAGTS